jgi:hypothetical protein
MGKKKSAQNGAGQTGQPSEEKAKRTRKSGDDAMIAVLSKKINALERKLQPVENVDVLRAELQATIDYRATLIKKKGVATLNASLIDDASQLGDVEAAVDEAFQEA